MATVALQHRADSSGSVRSLTEEGLPTTETIRFRRDQRQETAQRLTDLIVRELGPGQKENFSVDCTAWEYPPLLVCTNDRSNAEAARAALQKACGPEESPDVFKFQGFTAIIDARE